MPIMWAIILWILGFGAGYCVGFFRGYKTGRSDGLYNPTQAEQYEKSRQFWRGKE